MKFDVKAIEISRSARKREAAARGMSLKFLLLLLALSTSPPARTPLHAQADDAARVQGPAPAAESAKWERFTYEGEEFSVELPEMPFVFHTIRHVNRTLSDIERMRVFGVYSGGVVFMVVSYDEPRDKETFDDFAGYTQGGNLGGLVSKGNVTLKGFAGKEYAHPDGRGAARVFRAKKRAYLLKAYAKTEGDPKVARFLNSFKLETEASGVAVGEFKAGEARVAQAAPDAVARPDTSGGVGVGVGIVPYEVGGGPGPLPPVDYNRVFRQNEVTSKALLVYKPEPSFTEEARRNNVTGVVRLRAVLSSRGRVTNISVVKGLPDGLTERAISASRHMLFFPARKDGRDVSQYVVLEYNFNIY